MKCNHTVRTRYRRQYQSMFRSASSVPELAGAGKPTEILFDCYEKWACAQQNQKGQESLPPGCTFFMRIPPPRYVP